MYRDIVDQEKNLCYFKCNHKLSVANSGISPSTIASMIRIFDRQKLRNFTFYVPKI